MHNRIYHERGSRILRSSFLSLCTICAVFGAIKYDLTRAVFEGDATLYAAAGFGGFSVKYPTEENKD